MTAYAIEARKLGKRYELGEHERYQTLRDVLARGLKDPVGSVRRAFGRGEAQSDKHIWALRDASFTLEPGRALGVIGMNGAGKTTLLRLLTRITEPNEGEAVIRGRISSLLEVGTGFHPELTGRENVFVNGILLGMSRRDVLRKMDEIVAFSGIEPFIDTPVKRYSSGMQLRLAFSVAAHLEPDIVLVDEVLAVGDLVFQERCMEKMRQMSRQGRTLIYVSHNLPSVSNLCDRAIILDKGRIVSDGPAHDVVENYLNLTLRSDQGADRDTNFSAAARTGVVRLLDVSLMQEGVAQVQNSIDIGKPLKLRMTYEVLEPGHRLFPALHLFDANGVAILSTGDLDGISSGAEPTASNRVHEKGVYVAECEFPAPFFNDKHYYVTAIIGELPDIQHVYLEKAAHFQVHDSGGMRKHYYGDWLGSIRPRLAWKTWPRQS
jgi:lipopolysaccharide transport system ATP-binding protein